MKTRMQQWMVGVVAALALIAAGPAWADGTWWDINGATAGATDNGDGTAPGNTSGANWNEVADGTGATKLFSAVSWKFWTFSAGVNATGTYTVNVDQNDSVGKLWVEEGNVTLAAGGGAITFNGQANTYWGVIGGSSSLIINCPVVVASSGTGDSQFFNLGGVTRTTTVNGLISGTGTSVSVGGGNFIFNNSNNSFDAQLMLTAVSPAGVLTINSIKNWGAGNNSSLGAPTTLAKGTIKMPGAANTLKYVGTGDTTDRPFVYASSYDDTSNGLTLEQAGTGPLVFNGSYTRDSVKSGLLTLKGDPASPSAATAEFHGDILNPGGAGSGKVFAVTKFGTSIWILSGANTYAGKTTIAAGMLRAASADAIPGGLGVSGGLGNLEMQNGAVLELGATNLMRAIGTGAEQIRFFISGGGSCGFSAYGADRIVNLGNGGTATNIWVFGNNGTLILGSATANAKITVQNGLDISFTTMNVRVDDNPNSTADIAEISGNITGNSGFTKKGAGTLILSGNNTFGYLGSGTPTTIDQGVLRLASANALSVNSTLVLNGGVAELGSGNVTRNLSTTSDPNPAGVRFTGSGGFSAHGANRIVNFGGNVTPSQVTWNSGGFVPTGSTLIFGSSTADSQIEFKNPIDLAGAVRTIQVDDNTNSTADVALMSGVLSGTGSSGLLKTGAGKLILSTNNTYAGATTVSNGTLVVNGTLASSGITVNPLGTLGGTGTVGAVILDAGGTVAPGDNGTGTLTVASLTSASGGKLSYSVQSGTCGRLVATGALNVTNVQLVVTGTLPASGYVVLASGATLTGPFQSVSLPPKGSVTYVGNEVRVSGATKGLVLAVQ